MSLQSVLELVIEALRTAGIPYMLTGSLAGSYHGAPRATQDVDLIVDASLDALLSLATQLRDSGLYVSDEAIREAVESRGMFNAVDPETGWKIDFIIRKDRPFSRSEFESRQTIDFEGLELSVARAEDMIIAKLEWARQSDSELQRRDVVEIMSVQGSRLDRERIASWVRELGLESEWNRAKQNLEEESA